MEELNYKDLDKIISAYKENFKEHRNNEIYKWKAIKTFQDNWDIDAEDFTEMLRQSLKDSANLLNSSMYFPKLMIIQFSEREEETTRKMFKVLFNEDMELSRRYEEFAQMASEILSKHWEQGKNHYQDAHTISTYLTFRYPDKYYMYKSSIDNKAAKFLDVNIYNKDKKEELKNYFTLCDKVLEYIKKDIELLELSKNSLNSEHYHDDKFHVLTWDLLFYCGKTIIEFQNGKFIRNTNKQEMKYFETFNKWLQDNTDLKEVSIKHYCSALKIIENEFEVEIENIENYENLKTILNILYDNKKFINKNKKGNNMYSAALNQYEKYILSKQKDNNEIQYFWLNANPIIWSYSELNVGGVIEYTSENESGNKRRIYRNFLNAKKGDLVIAYESTPIKAIVGLCEVEEGLNNGIIKFKKIENIVNMVPYKEIVNLEEMKNSEVTKNNQGSFFKLTKTEYNSVIDLIREYNPKVQVKKEKYNKDKFLEEVYISENCYNKMVNLLKRKKNIILKGAPGVGKTFMAKRLAYSIIGEKDNERIKCIQFHQSYSYEDFIEGWRPTETSYKIEKGIFYTFCKKAENDKNNDYFFIIDEINRGNLSKIFGELLMLIEGDKREEKLNLAYSKTIFYVPSNVYIIGMMNTADRSLAIIDYALRRRFAFCPINPGFDSEKFKEYQAKLNNTKFNELIELIKQLNIEIDQDPTLGDGFKIGHSYFCNFKDITKEDIKSIIEYEILPLLEEYWFDDKDKYEVWFEKLNGVING